MYNKLILESSLKLLEIVVAVFVPFTAQELKSGNAFEEAGPVVVNGASDAAGPFVVNGTFEEEEGPFVMNGTFEEEGPFVVNGTVEEGVVVSSIPSLVVKSSGVVTILLAMRCNSISETLTSGAKYNFELIAAFFDKCKIYAFRFTGFGVAVFFVTNLFVLDINSVVVE